MLLQQHLLSDGTVAVGGMKIPIESNTVLLRGLLGARGPGDSDWGIMNRGFCDDYVALVREVSGTLCR